MREGGGSSPLCCADFPPFHWLKINSVQFTGLSEKKGGEREGGRERGRRQERQSENERKPLPSGVIMRSTCLHHPYEKPCNTN